MQFLNIMSKTFLNSNLTCRRYIKKLGQFKRSNEIYTCLFLLLWLLSALSAAILKLDASFCVGYIQNFFFDDNQKKDVKTKIE